MENNLDALNSITEYNNHLHVRYLTQIALALSAEKDLNSIFELIIDTAITLTNADAGTIYGVSEDGRQLEFALMFNRSLDRREGGTHGKLDWPRIDLFNEDGSPRRDHFIASVYHNGQELCFEDVYESTGFNLAGTVKTDSDYSYRCQSMLLIPLKNHEDEVLGIIQMINALDDAGTVVPFNDEQRLILSALASLAAISLSNRKLVDNLENLLLQYTNAIATGIERKSKFSSDHIHRVASFTDMIASRISAAESGHFAQQRFSADELQELRLAGLMHDVGKIVTPVTVLDKSVKLEAFSDGIETVALRFRVMQLLLRVMSHELPPNAFTEMVVGLFKGVCTVQEATHLLEQELVFLRRINEQEEHLSIEDFNRIERLAEFRIGYSGTDFFLLTPQEKENLQIRRGTLNKNELRRMNDHVSITWEMLSQLDFPRKYKNVAFYASTHHEKLNGKGYPFGFSADQLPLQSRILAIADIFEAITANDRPYKSPHTLSESLLVLAHGVKRGELDSELLDFILESGLYLDYAEKYMDPSLIDPVDIAKVKAVYS